MPHLAIETLLRNHHLASLSEADQAVLVLRAQGVSPEEIALAVYKHPRTVRAQLERLGELISLPVGRRRDIALTAIWTFIHCGCCVADTGGGVRQAEASAS